MSIIKFLNPPPAITRDIATKVLQVVDAGLVPGLGIAKPGKMCVEAAVCYALGEPHGDEPSCVAPVLRSLKIRLNDACWSSDQARAKGLRRLALAQLGSKDALNEQEFGRRVIAYALRVSATAALRAAASVCKNKEHTSKLIAAAARCETEGTREAARGGQEAAALAAANATYAAYAAVYDANAAAAAAEAAAKAAANAGAFAATAGAFAANAGAFAATGGAYATYAAEAAALAAANAAAEAAYATGEAGYAARDKSLSGYAEAVVQILIEMNAPGCQWLELAPMEAAS